MRMNGAVWLQSWTSSSSTGSTSSTTWLQLLYGCGSGTRPPASIAVPAAMRSGDAEPAVSASAVSACGVGDQWPFDGGRVAPCGPRVTHLGERAARQRRLRGRGQVRVGRG